jgi:hypothetical protein
MLRPACQLRSLQLKQSYEIAMTSTPRDRAALQAAEPAHQPSYEEQLATIESMMTCYDTPITQAARYVRDLLRTIIALQIHGQCSASVRRTL